MLKPRQFRDIIFDKAWDLRPGPNIDAIIGHQNGGIDGFQRRMGDIGRTVFCS